MMQQAEDKQRSSFHPTLAVFLCRAGGSKFSSPTFLPNDCFSDRFPLRLCSAHLWWFQDSSCLLRTNKCEEKIHEKFLCADIVLFCSYTHMYVCVCTSKPSEVFSPVPVICSVNIMGMGIQCKVLFDCFPFSALSILLCTSLCFSKFPHFLALQPAGCSSHQHLHLHDWRFI